MYFIIPHILNISFDYLICYGKKRKEKKQAEENQRKEGALYEVQEGKAFFNDSCYAWPQRGAGTA